MAEVPGALRDRSMELLRRPTEPAAVAWEGRGSAQIRIPQKLGDGVQVQLLPEAGDVRRLELDPAHRSEVEIDGITYRQGTVTFQDVPPGYHRVITEVQGERFETLLISAPEKTFQGDGERTWGISLPLYALRTRRDWGVGSFAGLADLTEWVRGLGGRLVGTLPLLATFLDQPFDPSPYSPASRLFWNELFIDVERAPELSRSEAARDLIDSPGFRDEVERARRSVLVDYELVARLKRRALELLAREWRSDAPGDALDYAQFRSACVRFGAEWTDWPDRQRAGHLQDADVDDDAVRYHLYVQALADQQLAAAAAPGAGLFMDLPLGVHPSSYDVWRERDAFARSASAGAPPDTFFTRGQNWGFPPLHPERIREQGYRYTIACLRHLMRHADVLRIDHVMGLHRLFWVPPGMEPSEGVYVRYRAEELYAILALESHRARTVVVGEDLGTVPRSVRQAMARHGLLRSCVLQYELRPRERAPLRPIPAASMATLNTHDMPTFAAMWEARDIDDRLSLGLLDEVDARKQREGRGKARQGLAHALRREGHLETEDTEGPQVLRGALRHIAASKAHVAGVSLEDLWWEREPQNTPGTNEERPNWRRRARLSFEEFRETPEVVGTLQEMDELRKQPP